MPVFTGGIGSFLLLAFVVYCVLDIVRSDAILIRNLPKLVWLLLVVVLPVIGGVAWLVAGRPVAAGRTPGGQAARHRPMGTGPWSRGGRGGPTRRPARPRPRGPDDDPEFLRGLDERLRRRDEDGQG